jgi:hypothetical protein
MTRQAFGALKALKDISQGVIAAHDISAFRERQIEFQQRIIDAQAAVFEMQQEQSALTQTIRDREEEIARLKAWDAEKQKYELKDVGHGAFVYARKADAEPAEPPHWLCTNCYTHGKKSIVLRTDHSGGSRNNVLWTCPECRANVVLYFAVSPSKPTGGVSQPPSG